jgi:signal transduction histidine kinase
VVQEALNNVKRHSGAQKAWVRLRFLADSVQLEVEDRGKGFTTANGAGGIGMVGMRERAELIGGDIQFLKPAEGGTLVTLRVPR